jgi:hypothetical protein
MLCRELVSGKTFSFHSSRAFKRSFYLSAGAGQQASARPATSQTKPNVVLIDAVRTPFVTSNGVFKDMWAVDLQRTALNGF